MSFSVTLPDGSKKEFDNFVLQDENRKFTEVYIAQQLQHNKIDKDAKVVITTIQRLYSMLCGEEDYDHHNHHSAEPFSLFAHSSTS